jgi:hypothetical protein
MTAVTLRPLWLPLLGALVLFDLATAQAQALEPGRYLVGENGEPGLERLVEIREDLRLLVARLAGHTPQPPVGLDLEPTGAGHYQGTVGDETIHLWVLTPHRILGWEQGDGDFVLLRRLDDAVLEALQGEWQALRAAGGALEWEAQIDGDRIVLLRGGERAEGPLWVMRSEGPTLEVAFSPRPGSQPWLHHLHPLAEGGFLAWLEGSDDLLVVQRPGTRPAWLTTAPVGADAGMPPDGK